MPSHVEINESDNCNGNEYGGQVKDSLHFEHIDFRDVHYVYYRWLTNKGIECVDLCVQFRAHVPLREVNDQRRQAADNYVDSHEYDALLDKMEIQRVSTPNVQKLSKLAP